MTKYLLTLALAVFLIGAPSIQAQKIAVIDINAVLTDLDEYKEAQVRLDKIAAEWNQEIAAEYDKIKSLYNKYQAEQVMLSEEVRAQREEEIMQKEKQVRELQKRKFGQEGELFLKRREIINPIQERVFAAIETFAVDRGYDIILDKSGEAGVLFAGGDYDKTDLIKRRLGIR
ncbi:MAG: OmpH family outer membrane protein [Bacteroidota bacterium]